ncbi:MAG: hypothetical protein IT562_11945 [Alphaproteobacteria bacterium]|nr:hypothetical protein [Alphaproteobacteria bacterium]
MTMPRKLAVLGGDLRECEIARLAAQEGLGAWLYGAPTAPATAGVTTASSAAEAVRDADVILLPIPHMTGDVVFAPHAAAPIVLTEDLLALARRGAVLVTGAFSAGLRERARRIGMVVREYGEQESLKRMRGPLIAEAALQALEEQGLGPKPGSVAIVVGLGAIGGPLARMLAARGVQVRPAVRDPAAIPPDLRPLLAEPVKFTELRHAVADSALLIATTAGRAIGADVLAAMPAAATIADVASPPGSFDHGDRQDLAARVRWLRALGGRQPQRIGAAQWQVIRAHLVECGIPLRPREEENAGTR